MGQASRVPVLVLCGSLLLGCGRASWQKFEVDDDYRPPRQLTIAVVAPPALMDVADLVQSGLIDDLESHGISVRVAPPGALPDANLSIARWDPGSRFVRWLVNFGAGAAQILVDVDGVGLDGTMYSTVTGGFFGGSSDGAATSAGHAIGESIATGRKEPDPRGNSHFAH